MALDANTRTQSKVPSVGGTGQRQADNSGTFTDASDRSEKFPGAGTEPQGQGAAPCALPAQAAGSAASKFGPESYGGAVNKGASGEGLTPLPDVHSPFITTKRGGGASTPSNLPVVPLS